MNKKLLTIPLWTYENVWDIFFKKLIVSYDPRRQQNAHPCSGLYGGDGHPADALEDHKPLPRLLWVRGAIKQGTQKV